MEIIRNVARHKLRSFLTISGIVIGVLALTTMGAMAENFNALLNGGVAYFGQNVQVGPPDGQSAALLPLSKIDEIKAVDGVAAAFPSYGFLAKPGAPPSFSFGVPDSIVAGDPAENDWAGLKTTFASGHQIDAGSSGQVVLGSSISKEFGKKVGDSIDLPIRPVDARLDFVNHSFTVVGILNVTRTAPDNFAYINTADGQMLLKDSLPISIRDQVDVSKITQSVDVYAKPGTSLAELDSIANRINSQVTGVKATKPSETVNAFKSGGAIFTAITTAAALLALIIGGLSVVNTMFMAVAERVREIGLKKAVGATTYNVMSEFLRALDGVTLDIEPGEFIAVVGRSGSGKTTMLDLLGLLLKPTAGKLFIDDVDTAQLGDRQRAQMRARKVGFVFQEYNLLSGLNVLENVMLPLRYVKNGKDGKQHAIELIDRVGLSDRLKHRPAELSGGQAQRVAIARSMVNRPSIILLDEPTGAVDTETAQQLVDLLKRLNREEHVTLVLVTHDTDIAGQATRQIRLKDGKVLTDEKVEELVPGA